MPVGFTSPMIAAVKTTGLPVRIELTDELRDTVGVTAATFRTVDPLDGEWPVSPLYAAAMV